MHALLLIIEDSPVCSYNQGIMSIGYFDTGIVFCRVQKVISSPVLRDYLMQMLHRILVKFSERRWYIIYNDFRFYYTKLIL